MGFSHRSSRNEAMGYGDMVPDKSAPFVTWNNSFAPAGRAVASDTATVAAAAIGRVAFVATRARGAAEQDARGAVKVDIADMTKKTGNPRPLGFQIISLTNHYQHILYTKHVHNQGMPAGHLWLCRPLGGKTHRAPPHPPTGPPPPSPPPHPIRLMICTPESVHTGPESCPTSRANAASSNGGCICPFLKYPRSPPCFAELQSDSVDARASKVTSPMQIRSR